MEWHSRVASSRIRRYLHWGAIQRNATWSSQSSSRKAHTQFYSMRFSMHLSSSWFEESTLEHKHFPSLHSLAENLTNKEAHLRRNLSSDLGPLVLVFVRTHPSIVLPHPFANGKQNTNTTVNEMFRLSFELVLQEESARLITKRNIVCNGAWPWTNQYRRDLVPESWLDMDDNSQ